MNPGPNVECWHEPETGIPYPISYNAYRRAREAEEKREPRHRGLGTDIDLYVWDRWGRSSPADAEIVLTLRPGTSPRVQRIVGEVVRAIGRGRPAGDAMRRVARRFGLRHAQVRAFIRAGIDVDRRARPERIADGIWSSSSLFAS